MKLISEQWCDNIDYLIEQDPKTGKESVFIEGIMLQTEVKNKNVLLVKIILKKHYR